MVKTRHNKSQEEVTDLARGRTTTSKRAPTSPSKKSLQTSPISTPVLAPRKSTDNTKDVRRVIEDLTDEEVSDESSGPEEIEEMWLPPKKKRMSKQKPQAKTKVDVLRVRSFDKASFGELGDEIWKLFSDIGWLSLLDCNGVIFPELVKEFYENLEGDDTLVTSSVLGVTIQIDDENWSDYLGVSSSTVKVQTGPWESTYRFDKVKALPTFFGKDMPQKECETLTRTSLKLP